VAQEREVIEAGVVIGWVGGPVNGRERALWYARPNPEATGVRLPERTMWRESEQAAVNALLDLTRDLRSTAKIKRLPP
jgi:hypothetical protein